MYIEAVYSEGGRYAGLSPERGDTQKASLSREVAMSVSELTEGVKGATARGGAVERSETEGEHLAALARSELFPFRLLITFAATNAGWNMVVLLRGCYICAKI